MKSYYKTWEKNYVNNKKYKRPVLGEGGWVKNSHGNSIKNDGYASYADVRKGEFDDAKNASVNMLDFRYSKDIVNGETYSWFNDAFPLIEQFNEEGGYRLYPDKISAPSTASNGSAVTLTHRWVNLGWGYCPTNIPQWNQKYKVAFALLDKTTLEPEYIFVDSQSDLSEWKKGRPTNYRFTPTISNVSAGTYIWAIGLVDTTKDNEIGIRISAKSDISPEGWLKIIDVTVN